MTDSARRHDVDHLGVNNKFLYSIDAQLAKKFATSCLERHHCAVTLLVMSTMGLTVDWAQEDEDGGDAREGETGDLKGGEGGNGKGAGEAWWALSLCFAGKVCKVLRWRSAKHSFPQGLTCP